jgi:hypothetical protein
MIHRFAASTAVASFVIALAALIVSLTPGLTLEKIYPVTILWCFVPGAWGIWALLIPPSWMPNRLPLWGAILGLIAGTLATFVLNIPFRFLGAAVSLSMRGLGVLVAALFYYLLWMLVRMAYRSLVSTAPGFRG